jgi:RNA-directed DNA polymerase
MEVDHKIPKSQGGKDKYDNGNSFIDIATIQRQPTMASRQQIGCNSAEPKPTRKLGMVMENGQGGVLTYTKSLRSRMR